MGLSEVDVAIWTILSVRAIRKELRTTKDFDLAMKACDRILDSDSSRLWLSSTVIEQLDRVMTELLIDNVL